MADDGLWSKLEQTWPARAAQTLWQGLTLPGDVAQGNVSMWGDDGHTSSQVINRSADLAGAVTLGAGAAPAAANELRSGIKVVKAPKGYDIIDSDGKTLVNADIGIVNIGGRKLAQIDDINTPALEKVTNQTEHDAAVQASRGVLGTSQMREAMRQFLEMHPDVEGFTGNRVSGARNGGLMNSSNMQNVTVKAPLSSGLGLTGQ